MINIDSFYHNQANLSHFWGHYRHQGSCFGALALEKGKKALPMARKMVISGAKKIGKELILEAALKLIEVATKRKNPKAPLEG